MRWRAAGRNPREGIRRTPRSLARKLLDGAIVVTILFLMAVIAARLDRFETKRISGDAVVNDGDSITLKGVRILFIGEAVDNERVQAALAPTGAEYVFVEAK